jgi:DNA-binding NarL/FixJ family response regulator
MIVDDHPLFRQGLRRMIEADGRFRVVAEASAGYEVLRLAEVHEPYLVLSDIQLPGVTGLKIASIVKGHYPRTRFLILSMHMDDEHLFEAVQCGAAAFMTKDVEPDDLLETMVQVAAGEQPIFETVLNRPTLARRVFNELRTLVDFDETHVNQSEAKSLSAREVAVLDCVAQGLSNREIAEVLYISEQTVKNHMSGVLRKLNVDDRVQAVILAIRNGWIELGPPPNGAQYATTQKTA